MYNIIAYHTIKTIQLSTSYFRSFDFRLMNAKTLNEFYYYYVMDARIDFIPYLSSVIDKVALSRNIFCGDTTYHITVSRLT